MRYPGLRPCGFAPSILASALAVACVIPPVAHAQNGTWSLVSTTSTVGPRREYGAIFDRANQRYILFDGFNGNTSGLYILFNDLWTLSVADTPDWTSDSLSDSLPGQRHSPQWGYDEARDRILMFGGYGSHHPGDAYAYLNDVWELDLDGTPHWTELSPAGQTPSGRLAGAAVFDPMRQRFVGFGGTIGVPVDTWVLNLQGQANWEPLPVGGTGPEGRWGMTSVYDASRDRMIIFGGSINDDYWGARNDVWELDLRGLPEWHQITTNGTPPKARRSGTAIYDPLRDRMVVYGGFDAATPGVDAFLDDTWSLDFTVDPPAWTQLAPAGTIPHGRDAMSGAYDPIHDRLIVHGGWSGEEMLADTRFIDWGGTSAEAVLTTTASSASPSAAHVEWNVSQATGTHAAIYRRPAGGEWTALTDAEVGGDSRLVFDDTNVQPDHDYSYMMVVGSKRGETFGGKADVHVPTTLDAGPGAAVRFGLNRVAPNPAIDWLSVSFGLTSAAPATIELLDVAGRSWLSRDVGALGAGAHSIDLATAGKVPPGLYFLRLRQAGHEASSRIAIAGGR